MPLHGGMVALQVPGWSYFALQAVLSIIRVGDLPTDILWRKC
jgi:hypothetical protein